MTDHEGPRVETLVASFVVAFVVDESELGLFVVAPASIDNSAKRRSAFGSDFFGTGKPYGPRTRPSRHLVHGS
jgi:hypothetical protein